MKKILFLILLAIIIINIYEKRDNNFIIPDASIRLRIIPNSNSSQDIYIKEQLKKYIESDIYKITSNVSSLEEARAAIKENIPILKNSIDDIFTKNNYFKDYKINYGNNYFPKKIYKGVEYNEGYYESLVIYIGEASGDNWWCVLFPNMCLIENKKDYEYKSYFKELISKYSKNNHSIN